MKINEIILEYKMEKISRQPEVPKKESKSL